MAAGLGFKTFTTGEVLTAGDTNGYLMQGVLVFANAAARTAAITSPEEGQVSYLKSDDSIYTYSGTAWVSAGLPSQTGNASKYLTTDGTTPSWGAVSADKTISQIASGTTTSGTSLSLTGLTSYDTLKLRISNITMSGASGLFATINSSSSAVYDYITWAPTVNANSYEGGELIKSTFSTSGSNFPLSVNQQSNTSTNNYFMLDFYNCKATGFTTFEFQSRNIASFGSNYHIFAFGRGIFKTAAAVSSIQFSLDAVNFTAGNYVLWGG